MADERPDWKQWIPIYGIRQAIRDFGDDKPSWVDREDNPIRYHAAVTYQAICIYSAVMGSVFGLAKLLQ